MSKRSIYSMYSSQQIEPNDTKLDSVYRPNPHEIRFTPPER
jgi:hypothetical protein